jgi:RimJ/RimL family protein N-acetyltransferase
VLGEVGVRNVDRRRRRAEISWWIAPEARGRGLATAATRLLAEWALSPEGGDLDQVWARIDPDNVASARVAVAAGFTELGAAGGTRVWARHR